MFSFLSNFISHPSTIVLAVQVVEFKPYTTIEDELFWGGAGL
jgi:hypothetical protein